ncbi:hypothetical protein BRADI_1g02890v3 [Brachypodium distachyon]|uniref:BACK domain-containing protein n=2 Tax=Brachypodium distachyon TaxID=15368 RepID=A0A2K2DHV3_BRADI|nr:hypothetical protein BRADI_1g02890v3 [Brachypodium distachyon]
MTIESALLYLEHGCSISQAAEVQCVIGAAKQFLAKEYTDFDKFCDEAMNISLAGIEAIFSSTDIHVISEEHVFKFLLHWARTRYLEPEERRKIWSSHLLPLVRFSHMTGTTLQAILACTDTVIDLDHEELTKRVTEVLLRKGYRAQLEGSLAAVTTTAERAYVIKPMKVVAFDQPCQQVVVYWDLTRQECSRIFPSGEIISHPFHLAGQRFSLMVVCKMEEQDEIHSFAVLLGIHGNPKGSTCMTVDHEFAARTGLSGKFVSHFGRKHTFTDDPASECEVLFRAPWSSFIADNSHFIDGVLHLRADITVVEQPAVQS